MLTRLSHDMVLRFLPFALLMAAFSGLLVLMETRPVNALTQDEVVSVIRQDGLDAGFERVRDEYRTTPAFRGECHKFMLDLGEAVFSELPDLETFAYSPLSVTCNYGFFQAYPYALLLSTKDIERARTYCLRVGTLLREDAPGAEAECFRGIGRALPFIDEDSLGNGEAMATFAVSACDTIAPAEPVSPGLETDQESCVSGAFNMLGRTTAEGRYGLRTASSQPFKLCELLENPETKGRCYGNFKWSQLAFFDFSNPLETFESFRKIHDAPAELMSVAWTIGYEYTRSNLRYADIRSRSLGACHTLPEAWQTECVRGAAIAFAKHGSPGNQHKDLIAFCSLARKEGIDPSECVYSQATEYLQGFYPPARFTEACNAFRRNLGVDCP